jgi:hypothetical protein
MMATQMNALTMRASKSSFAGTSAPKLTASPTHNTSRRAVTTNAVFGLGKKKAAPDPYVCRVCGYVVPSGFNDPVNPITKCPSCSAPRFAFKKDDSAEKEAAAKSKAKAAPKGKAVPKGKGKGKAAPPDEKEKKFFGLF